MHAEVAKKPSEALRGFAPGLALALAAAVVVPGMVVETYGEFGTHANRVVRSGLARGVVELVRGNSWRYLGRHDGTIGGGGRKVAGIVRAFGVGQR